MSFDKILRAEVRDITCSQSEVRNVLLFAMLSIVLILMSSSQKRITVSFSKSQYITHVSGCTEHLQINDGNINDFSMITIRSTHWNNGNPTPYTCICLYIWQVICKDVLLSVTSWPMFLDIPVNIVYNNKWIIVRRVSWAIYAIYNPRWWCIVRLTKKYTVILEAVTFYKTFNPPNALWNNYMFVVSAMERILFTWLVILILVYWHKHRTSGYVASCIKKNDIWNESLIHI